MGDVIHLNKLDKPPPSPIPKVCATCNFYTGGHTLYSGCHAFGNTFADRAWRECQGTYWQKKKGIWTKIKELFS